MKLNVLKLSILSTFAFFTISANAQVKVGNNPTVITPSAVLDVESTNKGVIFPRVTLTGAADKVTVNNPATGLLVYHIGNTAMAAGYYYWSGTTWMLFTSTPGGGGSSNFAGSNVTVYKGGYIGLISGQETDGITMGDFKFRIRRESGSLTTSNENSHPELMFIGAESNVSPIAYASTQWRNGNFDLYDEIQFGPSGTVTRNATFFPILKNSWYAWGNAGLVTVGNSVEKRQYTLTTSRLTDKTLYRIEWSISDPTPTAPAGDVFADAKVFIYVEMIVGQ